MKRARKFKSHRVFEAFEKLQKAINSDEPDIQIVLHSSGLSWDKEENKAFGRKIKEFGDEYKKFFMRKKIKIDLLMD
jgi:hypothetical protein